MVKPTLTVLDLSLHPKEHWNFVTSLLRIIYCNISFPYSHYLLSTDPFLVQQTLVNYTYSLH